MALIEIKNLSFSYPEEYQKVIDNFTLTVNKGDFLVLCGPSGCGKSTLLRQLKTVLAPHGIRTGEILFAGKPLELINNRMQSSKIGFVGQSPDNQIVTDKVWHELAFGLESLGEGTSVIRARVAEMASFFGIEDWFYKDVNELSGGQKQLLNLASVMIMQPDVLILDEPTAQLDPIAADEFLTVISKINREFGTTVILTEHRLEEAFPLATAVAVMENGKLLCKGSPKEVGKQLKKNGNKMFLGFPTPMRVWSAVKNDLECPVTVAEGRKWLKEFSALNTVTQKNAKTYPILNEETVITAENLWFRYNKTYDDVIKGLDLKIHKGEFFALMGGNGTGKTTALKLISGAKKAYRGNITVNGKVTALPQNPQTLFVENTVRKDLFEAFCEADISKEKQQETVKYVVNLCKLETLLDRHPYDLSGGEQQRTALAKVLLTNPDILLLDEPTKGFDAEFKIVFADIINKFIKKGGTVFMVSHDIEFCAEYAHRCALFFDGNIITVATADLFFTKNSFYTTAANRMAREILKNAVTPKDIIISCGGVLNEEKPLPSVSVPPPKQKEEINRQNYKKLPLWRKILGAVSGAVALIIFIYAATQTDINTFISSSGITTLGVEQIKMYAAFIISLLICAFAVYKTKPTILAQTPENKRRLSKRTVFATVLILVCIPVTLYFGLKYSGKDKYYFISFCVLIECMLPFFLVFEGRKPQARELVIVAVLCAMGIAGRAAFFMLPQFKPVAALTVIAGIAFGGETGFLVGAMTMLVSNVMFSQGPWTPWQMFAMGIIGFVAGIVFKKGFIGRNKLSVCIYGAIAVIILYGGIMNFSSALLGSRETLNFKILLTYYLTGFPMDLIHAAATFIFLWFGAEPMIEKMNRIKVKYGLIE